MSHYVYICSPKRALKEKDYRVYRNLEDAKAYQKKKYKKGDWSWHGQEIKIVKRILLGD